MEMIPSLWLGPLRGVFLANHLASTDSLTRTTKRQNIYQLKLTIHIKEPNKQQHDNKNYTNTMTDKAWFSHLLWYWARKRSGSILSLQPRSCHGTRIMVKPNRAADVVNSGFKFTSVPNSVDWQVNWNRTFVIYNKDYLLTYLFTISWAFSNFMPKSVVANPSMFPKHS